MVTRNPANAVGQAKAGRLAVGFNADFFILRKQTPQQSALDALLTQEDSAVRCTVVNGRVVYGDENLFVDTLSVDYQRLPATEGKAASGKVVSLNSALNFNLPMALLQINTLMQRYEAETLHEPDFERSRLLSSDDFRYKNRIQTLKETVHKLIKARKP